jgi:hypothetical protein
MLNNFSSIKSNLSLENIIDKAYFFLPSTSSSFSKTSSSASPSLISINGFVPSLFSSCSEPVSDFFFFFLGFFLGAASAFSAGGSETLKILLIY